MAEATKPGDWQMPDGDYAGDVLAAEAWQALSGDPKAVLIDVRTQIEWTLIGKPNLAGIDKEPVFLQWLSAGGVNKDFLPELEAALAERGVAKEAPLYFMCQSGGRSKMAAMQLTERGFTACYNVADGFEGELDDHRHRNSVNGWKASGLPWFQT
jgi:rhodanese-related sulfurtransferase